MIVIQRRANCVYYPLRSTQIYRLMSYPFRSMRNNKCCYLHKPESFWRQLRGQGQQNTAESACCWPLCKRMCLVDLVVVGLLLRSLSSMKHLSTQIFDRIVPEQSTYICSHYRENISTLRLLFLLCLWINYFSTVKLLYSSRFYIKHVDCYGLKDCNCLCLYDKCLQP